MQDEHKDNIQFKMRLDEEVEASVIENQVDDLRIEKLSHRMTLITILIPVLIVVILGVAYLDIKRRVVRTEDSGQLTAQTLSEDLQSRFSSLSVGQAMVEENYARLKDQTEQSLAKVQVNLKKLDDHLRKLDSNVKDSSKRMVSRSDMNTTAAKMDKSLDNLGLSIEEIKEQLQTLDDSLQQQLGQLGQTIGTTGESLAGLEQKLTQLQEEKLDKTAVELALKLEILKFKQSLNVTMDEHQASIAENRNELKALKEQVTRLKAASSVPPPAARENLPSPSGSLQEQTIQK